MEIRIKLSKEQRDNIINKSMRGKRGEDIFSQIRIEFCSDHDESECDRWENCRDCVLNNIKWEVKK